MRPLTESEKQVIDLLLSQEFPGVNELRAQVPHTSVVKEWVPGLPSIELAVSLDLPIGAT
jgi:hypothetical protein